MKGQYSQPDKNVLNMEFCQKLRNAACTVYRIRILLKVSDPTGSRSTTLGPWLVQVRAVSLTKKLFFDLFFHSSLFIHHLEVKKSDRYRCIQVTIPKDKACAKKTNLKVYSSHLNWGARRDSFDPLSVGFMRIWAVGINIVG
jgi:hypothetical protein